MDIFKKLTPTCIKETIERKEEQKKLKIFNEEQNSQNSNEPQNINVPNENDNTPQDSNSNLDISKQIFESSLSYPKIVPLPQNRSDIRNLKNLAYGRDSELSAILTYVFQKTVLKENYEEIKYILEQIAIVEMKHYEELSNAVVALGGIPTLTDGRGNVWTGRNITTYLQLKQMLLANIKGEKEAILEYSKAKKETNNETLSALYSKIIEDEKLHLKIFEDLLLTV